MKIKMNRTRTVSYKYDWLMVGTTYDTDKMPKEVSDKVNTWLKDGSATRVDDKVKALPVRENAESLALEAKQAAEREDAENLVTRTSSKSRTKVQKVQEE